MCIRDSSTEASYRFEREIDAAGVRRAIDRAARLLAECAGGSVAPGVVEALGAPLPAIPDIVLAPARVNRLLGTAFERDAIAALLARVDVTATVDGADLRCR